MDQLFSLKSAGFILDLTPSEVLVLCRKSEVSIYHVGDSKRITESGLRSLISQSSADSFEIPQFLSLTRSAKLLDISTKTLRRLIDSNKLDVYRVGSRIRLKMSDLSLLIIKRKSIDDYDFRL